MDENLSTNATEFCSREKLLYYFKVQDAYTRIAQICVYSVGVNGGDASGYVDDGEHGGGSKLRSVIEHRNLINVSISVVWVNGGVHFSEKRFRCIAQVA